MTHRRNFLSTTLAAGAATFAAPYFASSKALGAGDSVAPSERITLGVIGIGPRCTYDLQAILKLNDVQCVAIADVQQSRRDAGKKLVDGHYGNQDCELCQDFRELLARDDIDAVLIATGDRWHAAASILAAEAGKDVYSEKPCGITIGDCQLLDETFQRTGRIFQAGTQRRSVPNFIQAVQVAQSGKLGSLKELQATAYLPTLDNTWLPAQPTPENEVCNWNMWLGPAPWRPFNQEYVNGRWRGQYDFDSGARLLDWGAHTLDLCQWAASADDTMPVKYEPSQTAIMCTYANGVRLKVDFLEEPFGDRSPRWLTRLGTCPVRFIGEDGSIETGDEGEIVASSPALQKELSSIQRVRGLDVTAHARNFFDCIKSREQTTCNSTVMRRSHVACHAAALSWILNRTLTIDPATETFVEDDEANRLRSRAKRDWT
ncbi:Gfo/Idh/MocA family protein [Rhodopirellula baltica]|uniref:Oxidoreductase domain-containing protein n=1 Tax=Rhodopirellula baltica WH47 TaxID=991778 RepID=F2ASY7_RHOBT|nr:Gfo/Idh/MocA family oxidoreductase [Rhodopirellula baltica]EGF27216.1 oxidoreductase domain-containing protein [Rhodopirellula baltica WH47]